MENRRWLRNGWRKSAIPAYQFTASYSGNVKELIKSWVYQYQTGELGLGWRFDYPKIIRLNNGTGYIGDDRFVFSNAGSGMQALIYTATDGNFDTYVQPISRIPAGIKLKRRVIIWPQPQKGSNTTRPAQ